MIGLGVVALAVACEQTSTPPPTTPDDLSSPDLTVSPDLTPFNAPSVVSVSPASGINNVPTSITITGTDFRAGATVTVGGLACTSVVVVSSTSITCTVPAKPATCGPRDLVVSHPDDGKTGTGVKLFRYRPISPIAWAAPVNYATPATPRRVLSFDFNADGKPDLVTVNQTGNNITVKVGLGDGTFPTGASQNLPLGTGASGPAEVAQGDFNADGKPDLAVVNGNNTITVFQNQGATFTATVIATPTLAGGNTIAVGDVNGDTKLDLVIGSGTTSSVLPMLGNGTGGFAAGTLRSVAGSVGDLTLADVNSDGKLDLIAANSSTGNVSICLSAGSGTFANPVNAITGTSPRGVMVADLNADKKLDVVVANATGMNVSVLLGDGVGNLAAAVNQPLGTNQPESVWVGDVNGDGLPDILAANGISNTWSYLQGMTATQYAAPIPTATGTGAADLAVADA